MKLILFAALALATAAPACAQAAGDTANMPGVSGAQMTTADGAGVVSALDAKAGTVTIQHGPIRALNWPAMTMTFKAAPSTLLRGVAVGQSVTFKLMQVGKSTTLTAIQPK